MDETSSFFIEDIERKRKGLPADEGVAVFLNMLVSCSAWSAIDGIVLTTANGDTFFALVFYVFITLFGFLAYLMFYTDSRSTNARMPEVMALAITCVGSWGSINSAVSMMAAHSSRNETMIHLSIVVLASAAIFLHHTYRRPNFIFDLILG